MVVEMKEVVNAHVGEVDLLPAGQADALVEEGDVHVGDGAQVHSSTRGWTRGGGACCVRLEVPGRFEAFVLYFSM